MFQFVFIIKVLKQRLGIALDMDKYIMYHVSLYFTICPFYIHTNNNASLKGGRGFREQTTQQSSTTEKGLSRKLFLHVIFSFDPLAPL